jgi:hypothetical protein
VSQGVADMDEATREAWTGALIYDTSLRYVLRRFPWPFATKYANGLEGTRDPFYLVAGPLWNDDPTELTLVQDWSATATYAIGDVVRLSSVNYYAIASSFNQTPPNATYWSTSADDAPERANGDWLYAYRWPTDCIFARRLVPPGGDGRAYNEEHAKYRFRVGRDVNGLLIYTNEREAVLEYTMLDCDNLYTDDLWIDAFTWWLAFVMAPSLSRNGLKARDCLLFFERALQLASAWAASEQQQDKTGDPDWVSKR